MKSDDHLIYESYIQEGILDRTKAKLSGIKQTVGNVVRGATGKSQTPGTRTGADAKSDSISKGFDAKLSKEMTDFQSKLQKTLGVAGANEIAEALTQIDPGLADQYNSITQLGQQTATAPAPAEAPQAAPAAPAPSAAPAPAPAPSAAPAQAAPAETPQAATKNTFKYSGSNKNVSSAIDKLNSSGLDKQQILDYIKSKKK